MFTQNDIYRIYRDILIYSYRIYIITQDTMKKNNIHQGPHKFQHLAKQAGTPMEAISEALTRSDSGTTRIYVNAPARTNASLILPFSHRSNFNLTSRNSNRGFSKFQSKMKFSRVRPVIFVKTFNKSHSSRRVLAYILLKLEKVSYFQIQSQNNRISLCHNK